MTMMKQGAVALAALMVASCTQPTGGTPMGGGSPSPNPGVVNTPTALKLVAISGEGTQLLSFSSTEPGKVSAMPIKGLVTNDKLVGLDWRASNGKLYGLGFQSRLYTVDAATGQATQVGTGTFDKNLEGSSYGFDVNPAADRLRVVSETQQNLRLHPDTGAIIDTDATAPGVQLDGALGFAEGDANSGASAYVVGAAYTKNDTDATTGTTNYVLDARLGVLATQGTKEGVTPVVSPNTGRLFTVGKLGVKVDTLAGFDIGGAGDQAFAVFSQPEDKSFKLYRIDLNTGAATLVGPVATTDNLHALVILP